MPSGGWLILAIFGVFILGVFAYLLIKGHLDGKRVAATIDKHAKKFSNYLSEKRKHKKEAEAEIKENEAPKTYDPDNVVDFLDRTKKKWPPEE